MGGGEQCVRGRVERESGSKVRYMYILGCGLTH